VARQRSFAILASLLSLAALFLSAGALPAKAGTPDDSYKPERYYTQAIDEQTTTSTSFQDALTLTFTPPSTKNFLVIASALTNNSSTSYSTIVQLDIDGTAYSTSYHKPVNTSLNWLSFGTHKVISATGGVAKTAKVQYCTENALGTAYIKRVAIAILEVSNYHDAEDETENTTMENLWQDAVTLNFTPAAQGDWLILATANIANSEDREYTKARITLDGTALAWDNELKHYGPAYMSWGYMEKENLTAEAHTFKIQYATSGEGTAKIKNARITAVKLADLGDSNYAESSGSSSTSSTSYVDKTTLTFTPSTRNDYIIIGTGLGTETTMSYAFYSNLDIDGTSYGESMFVPPTEEEPVWRSSFFLTKENLTAAEHNLKIQYKTSSSSGTASIRNANIIAIKANTAESYSSSSHATIDNDYGAEEHSAYIWAHGLEAEASYDVAYYDAGANGDPSATAGTWHAVVFRGGSSPPANYNDAAGTAGYVVADSFTVQQEAIPEFPTVGAGIAVAGMCFGIYSWMRKRVR